MVRLVVKKDPALNAVLTLGRQFLAIDNNFIRVGNPLADDRDLAIYLDPTLGDPAFYFAAGTKTGTSQHFL